MSDFLYIFVVKESWVEESSMKGVGDTQVCEECDECEEYEECEE